MDTIVVPCFFDSQCICIASTSVSTKSCMIVVTHALLKGTRYRVSGAVSVLTLKGHH